jgi:hypothetical protein
VSETDGGNCMVPNMFSNLTSFFFFLQKLPLSLFLLIKHEDGEKRRRKECTLSYLLGEWDAFKNFESKQQSV